MKVTFKRMSNWERGGREGNRVTLGGLYPGGKMGSQGTSGSSSLSGSPSGKCWGSQGSSHRMEEGRELQAECVITPRYNMYLALE